MEIHPILGFVLGAIFVGLNAFFVLAEFAIVKVRKSRIQELMSSGNPLAPLLSKRILPRLDAYLSACQVGITIASLALGWIGEPTVHKFLQKIFLMLGEGNQEIPYGLSIGISFFLITAAHVILGELIPKSIAIQKADLMALLCARPLWFFHYLFYPILWIFNSVANGILAVFGHSPDPDRPP